MAETKVLLVEDDADDVFMIRKVLDRAPFEIELVVRENGRTALRYLSQFTGLDDPALPALVLLDLNMPVMDGHALLHAIRSHDLLAALPVVVLTTSSDQEVIRQAYADGANAVITKVDTLEGMSEIVNTIIDFWFHTARPFNPSSESQD
jgi:CheY-like chemotaxis protein